MNGKRYNLSATNGSMVNSSKELSDLLKESELKSIKGRIPTQEEIFNYETISLEIQNQLLNLRKFEYYSRKNSSDVIIY